MPITAVVTAYTDQQAPASANISPRSASSRVEFNTSSRSSLSSSFTNLTKVLSRRTRLRDERQLELDAELIHGIPLRKAMWEFARLWSRTPLDLDSESRDRIWSKSFPVQGFDMFMSHSWATPSKWKFLALLLSSGWTIVLIAWAATVMIVGLLCLFDILPRHFRYKPNHTNFQDYISLGPWIVLFGNIVPVTCLCPWRRPSAFWMRPASTRLTPCSWSEECRALEVSSALPVNFEFSGRDHTSPGLSPVCFVFHQQSSPMLLFPLFKRITVRLVRLWCVFELISRLPSCQPNRQDSFRSALCGAHRICAVAQLGCDCHAVLGFTGFAPVQ